MNNMFRIFGLNSWYLLCISLLAYRLSHAVATHHSFVICWCKSICTYIHFSPFVFSFIGYFIRPRTYKLFSCVISYFFLVFVFLPVFSPCTELIMQYFIMEVSKPNTHIFFTSLYLPIDPRTPVWSVCLCTGLSDIRLRDVMQSFFSCYFTATIFRYLPLLGSRMTCKDDPQVRVLCERNESTVFLFSCWEEIHFTSPLLERKEREATKLVERYQLV